MRTLPQLARDQRDEQLETIKRDRRARRRLKALVPGLTPGYWATPARLSKRARRWQYGRFVHMGR